MLPDYPELKEYFINQIDRQIRVMVEKNAPLFATIKAQRQWEGDRFAFENENGELVAKKFVTFEVEGKIPRNLSSEATQEHTKSMMDQMAKGLASQSEGLLFSTLKEVLDSTGNHIDARGKEFDPWLMWNAIEKMEIDFDPSGNPILPCIVMHPDLFASISKKIPEWEADQALQRRRNEVLDKKKEEWRDRETNRKLVG
jgi:hypothetical protein